MKAQDIIDSEEHLKAMLADYLDHHKEKYKYKLLKYEVGLQKPQIQGFLKGERSLTLRKAKQTAEFLQIKGY